jgi:hypothetical protein
MLDILMNKINQFMESVMPLTFLKSMLIIPKNQLYFCKLHKIVIYEYNKYIDEIYGEVENLSNKSSIDNKNLFFY